jgi:hypothetical protein
LDVSVRNNTDELGANFAVFCFADMLVAARLRKNMIASILNTKNHKEHKVFPQDLEVNTDERKLFEFILLIMEVQE